MLKYFYRTPCRLSFEGWNMSKWHCGNNKVVLIRNVWCKIVILFTNINKIKKWMSRQTEFQNSLRDFRFFLWRGPWKLLSPGMWCRVVWYITVLKCQRNLLPPVSGLGADGSRGFFRYTSTGLECVSLQKTLKLEPTVFMVLGAWVPGALHGDWISHCQTWIFVFYFRTL